MWQVQVDLQLHFKASRSTQQKLILAKKKSFKPERAEIGWLMTAVLTQHRRHGSSA